MVESEVFYPQFSWSCRWWFSCWTRLSIWAADHQRSFKPLVSVCKSGLQQQKVWQGHSVCFRLRTPTDRGLKPPSAADYLDVRLTGGVLLSIPPQTDSSCRRKHLSSDCFFLRLINGQKAGAACLHLSDRNMQIKLNPLTAQHFDFLSPGHMVSTSAKLLQETIQSNMFT